MSLCVGLLVSPMSRADEPAAPPSWPVAPQAEAPQAEAPKAEAPQAEAPKTEAPQAEAPKAEGARSEPSGSDAARRASPDTGRPAQANPVATSPVATSPLATSPLAARPEKTRRRPAASEEHSLPLRVVHVPLQTARNVEQDLAVPAEIQAIWRATAVRLYFRPLGGKAFEASEFRKNSEGRYLALVPDRVVNEPGFEYYLESELKNGRKQASFASAESPQRVVVRDLSEAERIARRLARHDGARNEFSLGFRYMNAGTTSSVAGATASAGSEYRDSYNQLDFGYTHRVLSDALYQISFGFGILGAKLGASRPVATATDNSLEKPGVYLGRAKATWEFVDAVGLDVSVLFGANQSGFTVGGGGALRLGRLTGTHLEIGAEFIKDTGYDTWFELAWDTVPGFMMSLRADLTSYLSGKDGMAVLPSFNVKWKLNANVAVSAFVGYGTRSSYPHGGASAGLGVAYQF